MFSEGIEGLPYANILINLSQNRKEATKHNYWSVMLQVLHSLASVADVLGSWCYALLLTWVECVKWQAKECLHSPEAIHSLILQGLSNSGRISFQYSTDERLMTYSFPHQNPTISPYFSCSSTRYSCTLPAFAISDKLPLLKYIYQTVTISKYR